MSSYLVDGDEIASVSEVSLPLLLPVVYMSQYLHDIDKNRVQLEDSSNYFSVMEVTVATRYIGEEDGLHSSAQCWY
jgi:hypothetical protein